MYDTHSEMASMIEQLPSDLLVKVLEPVEIPGSATVRYVQPPDSPETHHRQGLQGTCWSHCAIQRCAILRVHEREHFRIGSNEFFDSILRATLSHKRYKVKFQYPHHLRYGFSPRCACGKGSTSTKGTNPMLCFYV